MAIHISRRQLVIGLVLTAFLLAILGIGSSAYEWSLGVNNSYWAHEVAELFALNQEANVPTYFSAFLLLFVAVLASILAQTSNNDIEKSKRLGWFLFALLFAYLSLDEAASLHEAFTTPLRENFQLGGYLYFSWILVGIPVALLVGASFIPFILKLARHTQLSMILAAIVFLTGAVVIEAISAPIYEAYDYPTLLYDAVSTLEELMEMLGVIIVINALFWVLENYCEPLEIHFGK